ncbi:PREDICTED: uncharacterized protein LOC106304123 isoform X3 [Brassica oleracea var. oleracea]|uniref:uncharacterized protein LOC106304123 isoform X3 n=1 Tax=Brassica oleracea var. oleracea TaxID=109376 RepID=UPI0006A6C62E|nr:PREDICTED: uncharacterized protein LOC106304123 isoform X3 [Brassica oleracea var. oleracea]
MNPAKDPCWKRIIDLSLWMCWSYHITKKPRETTQGRKLWMNDFSGARKSKDMLMPWKKLDANEFGIQRSSISESTRMVANKLRKRGLPRC